MKQLPPFTTWLEVNNRTGWPKCQEPTQPKSGSLASGSKTAAQPSQKAALGTPLYIGELSAAFLLGHLCRVLWPLGLVLVLQLHGAVAPAEPPLSQKTPPRAQQHCCCFITRASTACTAPQHSSHGRDVPSKQPPARAPAATPTSLTLAQGRVLAAAPAASTVPCRVTQGISLFAAGKQQVQGRAEALLGLQVSAGLLCPGSQAQARAVPEQEELPAGDRALTLLTRPAVRTGLETQRNPKNFFRSCIKSFPCQESLHQACDWNLAAKGVK